MKITQLPESVVVDIVDESVVTTVADDLFVSGIVPVVCSGTRKVIREN